MSAVPVTVLVDFGSTFTKVRAVGEDGTLAAAVQHRTTVDSDVFDGLQGALDDLSRLHPELEVSRLVACSSAGGGLRLAVVGLIEDLTAEAGRQAALSAGARVIGVVSNGLADPADADALLGSGPDILLLVGGTDGGDGEVLVRSAKALAEAGGRVPVVLSGNANVQPEAEAALTAAGWHVARAPNVMPAIGTLEPEGVRDAVRDLFISHVIGGKLSGSGERLEELVRMATPDAVLTGVDLLAEVLEARGESGGVIVVDVGGATTDVHSTIIGGVTEVPGLKRQLLPQTTSARTVEADLGMRWNATGIAEAALEEGLIDADRLEQLRPATELRASDPGYLPETDDERAIDRELARLAIAIALRRHAGCRRMTLTPEGAVVERDGRDLQQASLLIGTGGIFGELDAGDLQQSLELAHRGRQQRLLPHTINTGIDTNYLLSAAGVLASADAAAARALLESAFPTPDHATARSDHGQHTG